MSDKVSTSGCTMRTRSPSSIRSLSSKWHDNNLQTSEGKPLLQQQTEASDISQDKEDQVVEETELQKHINNQDKVAPEDTIPYMLGVAIEVIEGFSLASLICHLSTCCSAKKNESY